MSDAKVASDPTIWHHSPDVAQVEENDRFVVLDLTHPAVPPRILIGPAAVVWSCIDGHRDTRSVAEAVAEAVGTTVEEVHHDVVDFLRHLSASGLVTGPTAQEG